MSEIISVVGAGGKTTFIEDCAQNLSKFNYILISTTTKMRLPKLRKYDYLIMNRENFEIYKEYFLKNNILKSENYLEELILLKNRLHYFNKKYIFKNIKFAKRCIISQKKVNFHKKNGYIYYFLSEILIGKSNKKFAHITDEQLELFKDKFEYIFLESDGAKGKSLKFPKTYEPVISKYTTKTIAIFDINMIGKQIKDNIYNEEEFVKNIVSDNFENEEKIISIEHIYKLITIKNGLFKNSKGEKILCINKLKSDYNVYNKLKKMLEATAIQIVIKKMK
ncbi:selenium cofactor biosynthesis protein YqeC [Peptoanaerobacter stomatis]